ncbi:hypothetical protein BDN71DRAFT_1394368 [Pleurotus eryngii]|uniref:Uncharacterized protein n=1 Tax=Pleurotus eryngii TaxID=5323 RepID=A0A9P6D779_PLEER|nr:hypothetical protein BDN71DRAFT_1394368 [Pleurotus eryngii]
MKNSWGLGRYRPVSSYFLLYCLFDNSLSYQSGLHVEWVKVCACAERWREEVLLLEEEMQQSIAYREWKAMYWDNTATTRTRLPESVNLTLFEGVQVYARRQVSYEQQHIVMWKHQWAAIQE